MRREYRIQQKIEQSFSRKGLIAAAVQDMVYSPEIAERLNQGEELLSNWINQTYWESKQKRLDQIRDMELQPLADHIIGLISLECTKPMKLVSIAAMAAKYLGMNDKKEAIHTMAEIIAVLRDTKLYRINPAEAGGYEVQSLLRLDESITRHKTDSCFVPPMVIRPRTVRHNRDSGMITGQGESLILGFYENHHDKDICLDVLNTLNRTEYCLNTDFLESVQEQYAKSQYSPEELKELSEEERQIALMDFENWKQFKRESKLITDLLEFHGNKFHLTHKVDKRGRIYSRGYHINTQGSSYRKAMIDLKAKEICTGVQEWTSKSTSTTNS